MFRACYAAHPNYTGGVSDSENYWPGKVFGLPEEGPRSVPSLLRRVAGICIDWAISMGVSIGIAVGWYGLDWLDHNGFVTGLVFVVMHMLFGLVIGGSPGHLLTKMRIAPIKGGALGIAAPLIRPWLIILVIPAIMMDRDQRGVHDRIVGTIMVSR